MVTLSTKELGPKTWSDFEKLAPKQGSCWCTYYQRAKPLRTGGDRQKADRLNHGYKENLVMQGKSHAMIVYDGEKPVGWCQYGPKEELPRIDAGRGYRKVEPLTSKKKLWRITCFFVDKEYRGKGVAGTGLKEALQSIRKQGGGIVEAYPVVSKKMGAVPEWLWFGTPGMFRRAGFKPVAPLGTSLQLMRRTLPASRTRSK
jgi:GNAT superfamily N-acetyltransferase